MTVSQNSIYLFGSLSEPLPGGNLTLTASFTSLQGIGVSLSSS
jgi:hypothetical protein